MEPIKSLLNPANIGSGLIKPSEYFDEKIPARRWEIAFDYKTKMYLTDEEHDYFLEKLAKGAIVVQVGQMTLTNKFLYIIPIKEKINKKPDFNIVKKEDGTWVAKEK